MNFPMKWAYFIGNFIEKLHFEGSKCQWHNRHIYIYLSTFSEMVTSSLFSVCSPPATWNGNKYSSLLNPVDMRLTIHSKKCAAKKESDTGCTIKSVMTEECAYYSLCLKPKKSLITWSITCQGALHLAQHQQKTLFLAYQSNSFNTLST